MHVHRIISSLCDNGLRSTICAGVRIVRQPFLFGLCDLPTPRCCLLQEHELNSHAGHSQSQLHIPGTRYRLTLDLVTLYTPLKHLKTHMFRQSYSLKPPAPLYPLQDFKALYKYCIIIIIKRELQRLRRRGQRR